MNYNRLIKARQIARKTFRLYNGKYPEHISEGDAKRYKGGIDSHLGLYRKTQKPCSRACCGNPRKHFKEKSKKEIISDEDFKQQLEEISMKANCNVK